MAGVERLRLASWRRRLPSSFRLLYLRLTAQVEQAGVGDGAHMQGRASVENAHAHGSKEPRAFGMEQSMAWSMWGVGQSMGRPGAWQSVGREHSGEKMDCVAERATRHAEAKLFLLRAFETASLTKFWLVTLRRLP